MTKPYDFDYCSFVFRETITTDAYIYYEEVTRDMPGFQIWPHAQKMDIEIPSSIAEPFTFIWKLPFKEKIPNSYIKHYTSTNDSSMPQTVSLTVEYPFHYRYHPCQLGRSFVDVHHVDPAVFIDCRGAPLYAYSGKYDVPIID